MLTCLVKTSQPEDRRARGRSMPGTVSFDCALVIRAIFTSVEFSGSGISRAPMAYIIQIKNAPAGISTTVHRGDIEIGPTCLRVH